MKITYDESKRFVAHCRYEERHLAKDAGFFFDFNYTKEWYTKDLKVVAALREYLDERAKKVMDLVSVEKKPWGGDISDRFFVPKDKKLDYHQWRALKFICERNYSYIAYDAGLGKTPISVSAINILTHIKNDSKILIVVPPFLVANWLREINEWQVYPYAVSVLDRKDFDTDADIFIIPDTRISDAEYIDKIKDKKIDLIIVDEVQRFLNESKRTEALYGSDDSTGLVHLAPKRIFLSGTMIRKGPIDLYPVLRANAWNLIEYDKHHHYGVKYCNAHKKKTYGDHWAWDYSGKSRIAELKSRIYDEFIIREKLEHNLPDLKGKLVERMVLLDSTTSLKKIKSLEFAIKKSKTLDQLIGSNQVGDIATYRKELALKTVVPAYQYIDSILKSSNASILVFGIHTSLIDGLSKKLKSYKPLVIYGKTKMKERVKIEKAFQKGETRVLIANINCMVGLNLTRGTRVVFAESSWDYTDNSQATSRAYRRGQKEIVVADHLVLADTIAEYVMKTVLDKKKTYLDITTKET